MATVAPGQPIAVARPSAREWPAMLAAGRQSDLPKKPPADVSLSDVRLSIALCTDDAT